MNRHDWRRLIRRTQYGGDLYLQRARAAYGPATYRPRRRPRRRMVTR